VPGTSCCDGAGASEQKDCFPFGRPFECKTVKLGQILMRGCLLCVGSAGKVRRESPNDNTDQGRKLLRSAAKKSSIQRRRLRVA
jgi:hypothetical protein